MKTGPQPAPSRFRAPVNMAMNWPRMGAGDTSTIRAAPTPNRLVQRRVANTRNGIARSRLGASNNGTLTSASRMQASKAMRRLPFVTPRLRQYSPSQLAMTTPSGPQTHMIAPIKAPTRA
ncbi:hypothetical protein D3C76_1175600 [compost metagenome]